MLYDDVEIQDMEWNEKLQAFTYPCPCGDLFQITKEDLNLGEEIAKRPSCSLFTTVILNMEDFLEEKTKQTVEPSEKQNFKMLPTEPTKQLSFKRKIAEGDLVIVYERHDTMKAVKVSSGSVLQNRFGVYKHSEWIGKPFGSKVLSNKGKFIYLLAPTPELWTLVLNHRTQILYVADISLVVMYLEVVPGCVVLESGTGSGSLSSSLARAVAPSGHVYTFDFHEERAASAREDFEKTGLTSLVTVGVRDIQGEGFPDEFKDLADAVFLDLPQPWLAIPSAEKMLKQDGVLCSFSPCIEQVQRSSETLRPNFTDIRTFEILLRSYDVREVNSSYDDTTVVSQPRKKRQCPQKDAGRNGVTQVLARPNPESKGHTGYLTFARLQCL